ncbi:MAG: copper homeostasis membrane protein CopD [Proteobacteria bacterium]|nr:copper homeostasis membrane protein CopD [Pseudomonadota bacterium]
MDDTLIAWRVVHYLATIEAAGVVFFSAFVLPDYVSRQLSQALRLMFWASLAVAFVSGVGWFLALAAAIDGETMATTLSDGTAAALVSGTQFGRVWIVRAMAGAALAACAVATGPAAKIMAVAAAAIFVGGLAFAGHAAGGADWKGNIHLVADILHVLAATLWLGGLLPYAICLGLAAEPDGFQSAACLRQVTRRYSNMAMVAVVAIVSTGIINTFNLVAGLRLLAFTDYGRLLLLKLAVFLAMLALAAANRFVFAPRIWQQSAISAIRRNTMIEVGLGLAIIAIVSVLGTMAPPLTDVPMPR